MPSGAPQIAVVAGGRGGIGSAVVHTLAQRGFHVVAGVRAPPAACSSHNPVRYTRLDLACRVSVAVFAAALRADVPWIDLLVLSGAETGGPSSPWQRTLQVNALAHAQLAQALRPLLQLAPRCSRVVAVSSGDGELVYLSGALRSRVERAAQAPSFAEWTALVRGACEDAEHEFCTLGHAATLAVHGAQKAYKLSKAALNSYVLAQRHWWCECDAERVTCIAVCPGDVDTPMRDRFPAGEVVSPTECVRRMWGVLDVERDPQQFEGRFWRDGACIAW